MNHFITNIFFSVFVFLCSTSCFSQSSRLTFGLRAGGFGSKILFFAGDDLHVKSNRRIGIEAGFFCDINILKGFSVSPEINFLQKGGRNDDRYSTETVFNQIEVTMPFVYQFRFKEISIKPEIGFFYGYILNGYSDSSITGRVDLDFKNNVDLNRRDSGFLAGLGIGKKVNRLGVSVDIGWRYRYSANLVSTNDSGTSILTSKIRGWGIYLRMQKGI